MAFKFIHTADWQIGKPFARFAPDVAVRLRAARLDAIDRLAALARGAGAAHILVAGDVIDSEHLDDAGLRQPLARMALYPAITWHLLPGNHDPARPGGVWQRLAALGLPANLVAHVEPAPVPLTDGVVLLPAPLAAREMVRDPTAWMDDAVSPPGVIRIGTAHGSVRGFGSLGEAAVPLDAGRRTSAGLDYLALGDWHGTKEVATGVWYSGTPEPDSFAANGQGNALVVEIAASGAPPRVRVEPVGALTWLERRLQLARLADLDPLERELAGLGPQQPHTVAAIALEGAVGAAERSDIEARLRARAAGFFAFELELSRLGLRVEAGDLAALGDAGLARVGERLGALATPDQAGDGRQARIAARALQLLLSLAAGARPGGTP